MTLLGLVAPAPPFSLDPAPAPPAPHGSGSGSGQITARWTGRATVGRPGYTFGFTSVNNAASSIRRR